LAARSSIPMPQPPPSAAAVSTASAAAVDDAHGDGVCERRRARVRDEILKSGLSDIWRVMMTWQRCSDHTAPRAIPLQLLPSEHHRDPTQGRGRGGAEERRRVGA
jgi:hypothetical protein